MLVVLQPDVEQRLVTLHQLRLEVHRLRLGVRHDVFEILDGLGQRPGLGPIPPGLPKYDRIRPRRLAALPT